MTALVFTVYGVAHPKGSMRGFVIRPRAGGKPRAIVTDSNTSVAGWQTLVSDAASQAMQRLPPAERAPLQEGVRLTVAFHLPRPKKYQRRGVPVAHLTKPDTSKLLRAVEDALTEIAYRDDSQIVELLVRKAYAEIDDAPHVDVRVEASAGTRAIEVPAAPLPLFGAEVFR